MGTLCARLGISHAVLAWRDRAGGNLQAAARVARHRMLGRWAAERRIVAVLLGHTLDDQAETVLLRLARGSGIDGLSGMEEAVRLAGTLWFRPALGVRRAALRDLLRARGIGWAEDPSNEDPRFDRVRARAALTALAPLGIDAPRLVQTADTLRAQRLALDAATDALAARAVRASSVGWISLALPPLAEAPHEIALRLVSDCLRRVSGEVHRPRRETAERLLAALRQPGFRGATLGGCVLTPRGPLTVAICREPARAAPPLSLGHGGIWDGRWRVTLAGHAPDDAQLGALGETGLAILRAAARTAPADWTDAPRAARLTSPAIWAGGSAGGRLLLAPFAGYPLVSCGSGLAGLTCAWLGLGEG